MYRVYRSLRCIVTCTRIPGLSIKYLPLHKGTLGARCVLVTPGLRHQSPEPGNGAQENYTSVQLILLNWPGTHKAEIILYGDQRVFSIWNHHDIYILVCSFCFIWIRMLWVCGHYKYCNYFGMRTIFNATILWCWFLKAPLGLEGVIRSVVRGSSLDTRDSGV